MIPAPELSTVEVKFNQSRFKVLSPQGHFVSRERFKPALERFYKQKALEKNRFSLTLLAAGNGHASHDFPHKKSLMHVGLTAPRTMFWSSTLVAWSFPIR
ncbi:hypothetical protein JCM19053_1103 [Vibrio sp. JCM 19053]|nr:hypothetical protein JCM19053_1103 [Vibrio sp. JCM 19053]